MSKVIALLGNPNSGKTTLFNRLTGSNAHVGNWPGVTVERKEGTFITKDNEKLRIIDLPGIYSLSPYSPEEMVSRDFITSDHTDVIINIVDGTNLERNLYLSTQALEMDVPMVIALNMMDLVEKEGEIIDYKAIEKEVNIPIIPISASTGKGIDELIEKAVEVSDKKRKGKLLIKNEYVEKASNEIRDILENKGLEHSLYYAVRYLDNDESAIDNLNLSEETILKLEKIKKELNEKVEDPEASIADGRYKYIVEHASKHVVKSRQIEDDSFSTKIDKIVTHKILGIPIFIFIIFLMFHITFTENLFFIDGLLSPGQFMHQGLDALLVGGVESLGERVAEMGANPLLVGLVFNGMLTGIATIVSFLPLILMLYLSISILEDTGYMARVAFIMDNLLRKIGLNGRALIPMIMGFGCSVPAITATRTLESRKDRILTIMLIPFMSCGAKLPIYALVIPIFFPKNTDLIITGIYFFGIILAILAGFILSRTIFKGEDAPFVMELPTYRVPSIKSISLSLFEKMKDFFITVGTTLTICTIVIWFLSNVGYVDGFTMVESNSAKSLLGYLGTALSNIFAPLGFGMGVEGWKATVAVLTGFVAKEAVVSTMGQLYNVGDAMESEFAAQGLSAVLAGVFSPAAALAFVTWNLLSTPCIAAVGAIKRELNDNKWFAITMAFQLITAWVASFLVYRIALFFL